MGVKDHRQKRKKFSNKRPLSTQSYLPVARSISVNGGSPSSFNVTDTHFRAFFQSPYISGDFFTANSHTYRKQVYVGPVGNVLATFHPSEATSAVSGSLQGYLTYPYDPRAYDMRDWAIREQAQRKALSKYFDKLRGSDLNLTVDLAESKKSWKMLTKSVSDVVRIARQCRRDALNFARWNSLVQSGLPGRERRRYRDRVPAKYRGETDPSVIMGNRWLEWQYGWRPLLSSIHGVCGFARRLEKTMLIVGNSKARRTGVVTENSSLGIPVSLDFEHSSYATYKAVYVMRDPFADDVSRLASLNPLGIAWELMPYSFVVDWFFDIGGFMEECETAMAIGLIFQRGYEVSTMRSLFKWTCSAGSASPYPSVTYDVGSEIKWKAYDVSKFRYRMDSTPLPFPPKLQAKLGASRLLSAAALLRQLFSFSRR